MHLCHCVVRYWYQARHEPCVILFEVRGSAASCRIYFSCRRGIRFPYSHLHLFFFFNDTATTEIYTLSLHDALPIYFFAARKFTDLDDLNVQAEAWCRGLAADRRCPGQDTVSVREAFAAEAPRLLALPDNPYPLIERVAVKAGKTPYVRFDLNDYSIPHPKVQRLLTVLADPNVVRIVDGAQVLACHRRSYDKGAQIEDAGHVQALVQHKRAARRHRGTDHLAKAAPESQTLLLRAAERGDNLGTVTAALLRLLERYGAAELDAAIREAIERGVPHPNAVRLALDHPRELRDQPPPVP